MYNGFELFGYGFYGYTSTDVLNFSVYLLYPVIPLLGLLCFLTGPVTFTEEEFNKRVKSGQFKNSQRAKYVNDGWKGKWFEPMAICMFYITYAVLALLVVGSAVGFIWGGGVMGLLLVGYVIWLGVFS